MRDPKLKNNAGLDKQMLENGDKLGLRFDDRGLIPVFVTDAQDGRPLMMAYMNLLAVQRTIETGEAHYFSRSRQELWHKGATSGQIQIVREFRTDCDQDALWLSVEQTGGGCCHVGHKLCFYRSLPVGEDIPADGQIKLENIPSEMM